MHGGVYFVKAKDGRTKIHCGNCGEFMRWYSSKEEGSLICKCKHCGRVREVNYQQCWRMGR